MPDFLPDPLVSALLEISDPRPPTPAPENEPPSRNPRRGGAALAAVALGAGITIGVAAAPGPSPSVAASDYTVTIVGAGNPDKAATTTASAAPAASADDTPASDPVRSSPSNTGSGADDDPGGSADGTGVPDDTPTTPAAGDSPPAAATEGGATNPTTAPGPVWVISVGALDLNDVIANSAPLQSLASFGLRLPNYQPLDDTELSNGVALLSGKAPNESYAAADTLAGQLTSSNRAWKAYVEDLAVACSAAPVDDYDPARNPFIHFNSISPADCIDRDVDLSALDTDLAHTATTPDLSWIVPDSSNDGTGQNGVAALATFLTDTVAKITATSAYQSRGLILVVPDGPPSPGQPSGALLLSPSLTAGADNAAYGPYSLLRGLQDRFGLTSVLAHAGDPTSSPTPIPPH